MQTEKQQYLYVLRLIPRLLREDGWTEQDHQVVSRHFDALQRLLAEGRLILAGRTLGEGENCFGLVILEAQSTEEARQLMESDPAVREGIMTAILYPYRVALLRGC